jgi:hypothetical protein
MTGKPSQIFGIVGMVLGILSLILCSTAGRSSLFVAVPGLICSILQLRKGKSKMAVAGVVCTILAITAALILIIASSIARGMLENLLGNFLGGLVADIIGL